MPRPIVAPCQSHARELCRRWTSGGEFHNKDLSPYSETTVIHRPPSSSRSSGAQTLSRALRLLEAIREVPDGLSAASLCDRTALPKGTVHRLLNTLMRHGFVERNSHCYRIGLRAFVVGSAFLTHLDLRTRALPFLFELRNLTGETVQIAVLENYEVVFIERVLSQSPVAYMKSRVGAVLPAYCTGLGKALLAFAPPDLVQRYLETVPLVPQTSLTITDPRHLLEELAVVRRQGCAVDRGEREAAVRGVAAPVFDHEGNAVAAVSVAGPADRMPLPLEGSVLARQVKETAREISIAIGYVAK